MPKVIVVGGGLAGVATAYELARRGYKTKLVEAKTSVALGTSYANGSILTPSMADPWNSPGVHRNIMTSFFDPHSAIKLRLRAIPSLVSWGARFLLNSKRERYMAAALANFLLARYSIEKMRAVRSQVSLNYDCGDIGTLKVFQDRRALEASLAVAERLRPSGLRFELLDSEQTVAIEPALVEIKSQIAGSMRFPDDESGDAKVFCEQLADETRRLGGKVLTDLTVKEIRTEKGVVSGVDYGNYVESADLIVVASGISSSTLLKKFSLNLPIRPAKGYSVTFDTQAVQGTPKIPIIDDAHHAAVVPLGNRLRIAGTAEFAGNDLKISPVRVEGLFRILSALFPQISGQLSVTSGRSWAGLRPMSADGCPFIGPAPLPGLYINTGHGHLGWTMAMGSAYLLADLIDGKSPEIDPGPYRVAR